MRGLVYGLVVGGLSLGCTSPKRDFQDEAGGGGRPGDAGLAFDARGYDGSVSGDAGPAFDGSGYDGSVGSLRVTDGAAEAVAPDAATPPAGRVTCTESEYADGNSCRKLTICGANEFEQSPPRPDQDRVCGKATACGAGEYEKAPPTAESNRVCSAWTACGAGTFVSNQAAAKADRVCSPCAAGTFSSALNAAACTPWTPCKSGETESVAPGATSDRVCSTCGAGKYDANGQCLSLTVCSSSEYEFVPATAVSDRKCAALTVCQPGTKQTAAATATTDRQCAACSTGTFSAQLNAGSCSVWTKCGTNEYESAAPSAQQDRACASLTACPAGTHVKTAATATAGRVCEACASGSFTSAENVSTCQAWTNCAAGFSATSGSASKDRVCTACGTGTFSSVQNAASCKAWTTCTASQNQSKAGSATSDAVCMDKPACSTAKDRTCTAACPCASAEGVCTANDQCASGTTCVSGSGKKVGRTGDTCLAAHCNNDVQDAGETSVDCGGECGCRATFEIVQLKNVPSGANFSALTTMSRDGKRLAGYLGRGQTSFPAAVAYDGTVTELENYGKGGSVTAANSDGSVLVGSLTCADPPSCTTITGNTIAIWSGAAAPTVIWPSGTARGISSSGTILAGDFYNDSTQSPSGFIFNGSRTLIPDLPYVRGMTSDGRYVVGTLNGQTQGGLWFVQTQAITKIGPTNWTSITIAGVNGTDPAVIGQGYVSSTDTLIGFRWKGGVLTDLGLLAGGKYTNPYAVSLDGGIVVGLTGTNDFQQAFVWTDTGKLRPILDELKARGVEPPIDIRLTSASLLSDDGKTIVGVLYGATPFTFWRVVLE